jgi:hypothetical protein
MDIILLFALIVILAGTYLQLAHMRGTHNKPWAQYGRRHHFTAENGVYTDEVTGRMFDMKEVKHEYKR